MDYRPQWILDFRKVWESDFRFLSGTNGFSLCQGPTDVPLLREQCISGFVDTAENGFFKLLYIFVVVLFRCLSVAVVIHLCFSQDHAADARCASAVPAEPRSAGRAAPLAIPSISIERSAAP